MLYLINKLNRLLFILNIPIIRFIIIIIYINYTKDYIYIKYTNDSLMPPTLNIIPRNKFILYGGKLNILINRGNVADSILHSIVSLHSL